ncbi:hypothetical protein ACN263_29120 [Micromonospora sp. WMMD729]|uniref:hypothetical protein n=1 Tax=Micromonospora sp. WMMD729 TaxID=3404127 RepID=UPI003BF4BBB3
MLVLTILSAQQPDADPEIIALTVVEIRRLINAVVLAVTPDRRAGHTLHWSISRRTSKLRPTSPLPARTGQVTVEYPAMTSPVPDRVRDGGQVPRIRRTMRSRRE